MKYTANAALRAEREIEERRRRAEDEQSLREDRISEEVPEIGLMRRSLKDSYFSLIRMIAAGEPGAAQAAELARDKNAATQERIAVMLEMLTGDRDYLEVKYVCPKCRDTGYIEGERCECLEALLKKYTVEELNESSAIRLHDFSEYDPGYYTEGAQRRHMDTVFGTLKQYSERFPNNCGSLLFVGGTGLGKTFFSACIVKTLGERGIPAAFMSAYDMLRSLENEHFGRSASADTMDHLLSVPLLITDDLGAEPAMPIYETFLYNIINGRINRRLPMIISTNLPPAQIKERYHERLASRIMAECSPVVFQGSDIRQQKALRKMNETKAQ